MSTDDDDKLYTDAVKLTAKMLFRDFREINNATPIFRETVNAHDVGVWTYVTGLDHLKTRCVDMPLEYPGDDKSFKAFRGVQYGIWQSSIDDVAATGAFTDHDDNVVGYNEYQFKTEFDNDVIDELEKMFAEADIELNGSIGIEHDFEYSPATTDFVIYFEIDS